MTAVTVTKDSVRIPETPLCVVGEGEVAATVVAIFGEVLTGGVVAIVVVSGS